MSTLLSQIVGKKFGYPFGNPKGTITITAVDEVALTIAYDSTSDVFTIFQLPTFDDSGTYDVKAVLLENLANKLK